MQDEIWLPIICYEHEYQVSNLGEVKSVRKNSNIGRPYEYFDENFNIYFNNGLQFRKFLTCKHGVMTNTMCVILMVRKVLCIFRTL
ncbi:MAG: hypothetical protein Ta2E_12290 [Mycoplasmoidaceae bacterium]|nr:MAG: hypothetical protein Ta2E_12290 [Mycoplasmoidaceae bacterium]